MTIELFIDGAALDAFLGASDGPLALWLTARAERVQTAAKTQVGYDVEHSAPVATGPAAPDADDRAHLRDTIVKRFAREGRSLMMLIGSPSPIALLHHEGTAPHDIFPRKPGGRLAFYSARSGGLVILPPGVGVHHPGTRPNRYLTDNLPLALT